MVERSEFLDRVFHSLADGTRRDMLQRLSRAEHTVGELARPYSMSLAAIAKHVSVLERAGLVTKQRNGKERVVRIAPKTMRKAGRHLSEYERLWAARFDALEGLLNDEPDTSDKSGKLRDRNAHDRKQNRRKK